MNFTLTPEARQWQEKLRAFVDRELIPHELEAEMNEAQLLRPMMRRERDIQAAIAATR
jgi:hypothetical protein